MELAVLDRSGRLQIPREYLEEIGAAGTNKLLVELEDGKIVIQAPHQETDEQSEAR